MTLRFIQIGNALPISYPLDPTASFQPGQIAQLGLFGNNITAMVSDGTSPFGIIDDIKTKAFYAPVIDEIQIVPAVGVMHDGHIVSVAEVKAELNNPNINPSTFMCTISALLKPRNGVLVFPAGTELNYDADGDGTVDSIRSISQYAYQVPEIPGDDSTAGSNRMTIWFHRLIASTDQYEVSQRYPINAPLFVSELGYLTTRQPTQYHPVVAQTLSPPTSRNSFLDFLWL